MVVWLRHADGLELGIVDGVVPREYFERLTDKFRSPHIWMLKDGAWQLRRAIYDSAPDTTND